MQPIKISLANAVELAEAAVRDRGPDYVHTLECVYSIDGEAACLVGYILHLKGQLQEVAKDDYFNSCGVLGLRDEGIVACDDRTYEFLRELQSLQDLHWTWGLALQRAIYMFAPEFITETPVEEDSTVTHTEGIAL